ncbi:MAG: hypothetical protein WCL33_09515, partial [Planctomycetota bacterium]
MKLRIITEISVSFDNGLARYILEYISIPNNSLPLFKESTSDKMKNTLQKNLIITIGFATIALTSAANAQAAWENVAVADGLTPV